MSIEITGIEGLPLVKEGDDLSSMIERALKENNISLEDNDILVVAETVVSKAEGNHVKVDEVEAQPDAVAMSKISGKNAKECQIILDESDEIVRCQKGLIITRTHHGFVCANSGIDNSNCEVGYVTPLPVNPDKSAGIIKKFLDESFDCEIGVIISDTHGRAWRIGAIGVAVGISGMHPCTDFRGSVDLYGNTLRSTVEATADELASAASLVMGQSDEGICVVLIRGYNLSKIKCGIDESSISEIIRDKSSDAFR